MKKSLIALAVLAASGASMAQSSVTLYGLADVYFGSEKVDGVRNTVVDGGGFNTSRFGFKGSEDLGGGLKANFQLEQGFDLDTGKSKDSTQAFSRQAWVGLSGGFGEVQVGKVWTSYDDIRSSANDTFNANKSASFNTWEGYTDIANNAVKYISPTIAGFSGSLTYGLGEDKSVTVNKASSLASLGLQYANGPLFVGFAHQSDKFQDVAKTTHNLLNGSYDFGVAKVVAGYNQAKTTVTGFAAEDKAKEYNLGVEAPLAANLKAALGYASSKYEFNGADEYKTKGYSAALMYNLSKRTALYGILTRTKGEDLTVGNGDFKDTLYAVGVNHSF